MLIKIDRLMNDITQMADIGALENGGVCRPAMSEEDRRAREFLTSRMRQAGLECWTDAAGNVFGRRDVGKGYDREAAAVLIGSHIDSVEDGGRFDGVVGVLGALECVRVLDEGEANLQRPIEIVAFNDEEERFLPFLGSRAFVGELRAADIEGVCDKSGVELSTALQSIGCDPKAIASASRDPSSIAAFLELHIEQGPLLDRERRSVGVVEGIKGNYRWEFAVEGQTNHAGAPSAPRADAFMELLRIINAMREYHDNRGGDDATFTIGRLNLLPNIETAQPGLARCSIDIRSSNLHFLEGARQKAWQLTETADAESNSYRVSCRDILLEKPVAFHSALRETALRSAESHGYRWRELSSGAGHDAQVVGRHVPTAMIFVPSAGGRSHCPEEFTRSEDIEHGVTVLFDTLSWLAVQGGELEREQCGQ